MSNTLKIEQKLPFAVEPGRIKCVRLNLTKEA